MQLVHLKIVHCLCLLLSPLSLLSLARINRIESRANMFQIKTIACVISICLFDIRLSQLCEFQYFESKMHTIEACSERELKCLSKHGLGAKMLRIYEKRKVDFRKSKQLLVFVPSLHRWWGSTRIKRFTTFPTTMQDDFSAVGQGGKPWMDHDGTRKKNPLEEGWGVVLPSVP